MEIPYRTGSYTESFSLEPDIKALDWKATRSHMKEIHLLTLRPLLEGKSLKWLSARTEVLAYAIFGIFSLPFWHWPKCSLPLHGWCQQHRWMQFLHSNLLAPVRKHTVPPCSSDGCHLIRWVSAPPICVLPWPPPDLSAPHPSELLPQSMPD